MDRSCPKVNWQQVVSGAARLHQASTVPLLIREISAAVPMQCPEWLAMATMQGSEKVREFLRKSTRRSKNENTSGEMSDSAMSDRRLDILLLPRKVFEARRLEAIMRPVLGGKPQLGKRLFALI